jgi:hypothetical protein
MQNYFAHLNQINVSEHIERKGAFSYLSWPFAVAQLRLADPAATWEVRRFAGLPFLKSDCGHFVEVAVTVQGVTLSQIHPVLDAKNRPIAEPTSFDINTSIQRCLVKAIALHGLGLYIYAGEDLPDTNGSTEPAKPIRTPEPAGTPAPTAARVNVKQLDAIRRALSQTGTGERRLLDYFQVEHLEDLAYDDFPRVMRSIQNTRSAA